LRFSYRSKITMLRRRTAVEGAADGGNTEVTG
jgi:hypothetical protein